MKKKTKFKLILGAAALGSAAIIGYQQYQDQLLSNPNKLLEEIKKALKEDGEIVSDSWILCKEDTSYQDKEVKVGYYGGITTSEGYLDFFVEKGTGNLYILD